MVQRNGMPGRVRFRTLRVSISKYRTRDFVSRTGLRAASLAMPVSDDGGESSNSTLLVFAFYSPLSRRLSFAVVNPGQGCSGKANAT